MPVEESSAELTEPFEAAVVVAAQVGPAEEAVAMLLALEVAPDLLVGVLDVHVGAPASTSIPAAAGPASRSTRPRSRRRS